MMGSRVRAPGSGLPPDAAVRFTALLGVTLLWMLFGAHPAAQPAPRRIVSLVPAVTEMLFAIGAGDRVTGVSSFDRFPPEVRSLPKVGGLLDPDLEAIIRLRPDLVVTYRTQTDLRTQLDRLGLRQYAYAHGGMAQIAGTMRELGRMLGLERGAAEAAARIDAYLDRIERRVAGRPRPRTLLVFGREAGTLRNIYAAGGTGFLHDMLDIAGGSNVLADVRRENVQVSTELVLVRAPDVIIELESDEAAGPDRAERARSVWGRLASVPAVRTGRIHVLIGQEFVIAGPRVGEATEELARALHPGAFGPR